ncbi:23S rRNA (adenine(2503)-C(2))-methyltransferase RlmN [Acholeplasma sp. OttesenSCG-928-E16]|nr:23S rRNA (adenine(2503)-C(2))-methyltransferase RlmN [Acholeplasma sp. OttesenSCG-928-E16]
MLIYDLTLEELESNFIKKGFKKYRALQVFEWLYKHNVESFDEMTNIPSDLLDYLKESFTLKGLTLIEKQESEDQTIKLLYKLNDGNLIETVLMNHHYGKSICVTTQVGCNMGCLFCASGQLKKIRDLSSGEITMQIIETKKILNTKINYVVVMGIGEPFDNFNNLKGFLFNINNPKGLAIGARHITVSTCGIIPKIDEFASIPFQVNLAISLHAPNDHIRSSLMPINKRYPINDLITSVKDYILKTKRRVTIEYILISDFNDKIEDAKQLAALLKGMNVYVNLIPYNEVKNVNLTRSKDEARKAFYDTLKKNNINVTLRRETGLDIAAACGQLRSNNL